MKLHEAVLIFPHQLFREHPAIAPKKTVVLIEESLFFRQYHFHKKKLVLHRASMKFYESYLDSQKIKTRYIESTDEVSDIRLLIPKLAAEGFSAIHYAYTADNWLEKRIGSSCMKHGIKRICYPSPNFINTETRVEDFFKGRKNYFQTDFYIWQRRQKKILVTEDSKPVGGKWSFDQENRKKIPAGTNIPAIKFPKTNHYVEEAIVYVEKNFPGNYGTASFENNCFYPVDFVQAEQWLDDFINTRLADFGRYEDAMLDKESYLYHAVLTPMLNIGLLDPMQVIRKALEQANKKNIPVNSLEGFIRQVLGWREFIHLVYTKEGSRQRSTNYWNFRRKIPASFWNGTTGIEPLDMVIRRTLATGYSHHIERLMVLGNFMLLCEFDPADVYRWFMEMYVDAYDWVMVPNVYGMSQFADGGLMTTKPYISGSNYLLKMGNWKKGSWQEVWDGLFWRFLHVHRNFFASNPRLGMLLKTFDNMAPEKRSRHLETAENFLLKLDNS